MICKNFKIINKILIIYNNLNKPKLINILINMICLNNNINN